MEKNAIKEFLIRKFLKSANFIINVFAALGFILIIELHKLLPFFPVLFLFDFCFFIGLPLFLKYVLKKKWFECTKNDYLGIKYIYLPWLIMEISLLLWYFDETLIVLQKIAEET